MGYERRPFQPTTPYLNQVVIELNKANDNFDLLAQAFVSNDPGTYKVKEADTVDGFHASTIPAPNIIKPLDESGKFYTSMIKGATVFDPPDFVMSNNAEYLVGSVNITTPSWSPSGAWKLLFNVKSYFYSQSTGVNNFITRVKTDTYHMEGAFWYWNASQGNGIGVGDIFFIPEILSNFTQQFNFFVMQGGGNANAVFQLMVVEWYLFPA